MTRDEQLRYCKVCTHRMKDLNLGLVCDLTGDIADFHVECASFLQDQRSLVIMREQSLTTGFERKLASQGKRLANYLIDQVFLLGISLLFGVVLGIIFLYVTPEYLHLLDEKHQLIEYFIGLLLGTVYYSFFEGFTGRSLGKFFTRTKVVTEDGKRPDFKSILLRSLCRLIPFDLISFLGSNKVGWHDKFSRTRVVEME